jgi:hypothetical protein
VVETHYANQKWLQDIQAPHTALTHSEVMTMASRRLRINVEISIAANLFAAYSARLTRNARCLAWALGTFMSGWGIEKSRTIAHNNFPQFTPNALAGQILHFVNCLSHGENENGCVERNVHAQHCDGPYVRM